MDFAIKEGEVTHVTLNGKLDFARAPVLMEALSELKDKEISSIVFGCASLSYISSSGIRAIIFAQQKIAPNMKVVMEDVNEEVAEVLEMCGITDFIEVTGSQ